MTVIDQRERMQTIRARLAEQRKLRTDAHKAVKAAQEAGDSHAEAVAVDRVEMASSRIEVDQNLERQILHTMAGISNTGVGAVDGFLDDPNKVETLEALANSSAPIGALNLGWAQSRESQIEAMNSGTWGTSDRMASVSAPSVGGVESISDGMRAGLPYGIVAQLRRQLSILDLVPTQAMEVGNFTYQQESGSMDFAAEVNDLTLKPSGAVTLTQAEVIARTIPAWFKLSRPQLADVPALATTVQARLLYAVRRRLENQILGGNGVGPNILGILNTSGIGAVPFVANEALSDLVLSAITTVRLSNAQPNAVILHPNDWATMLMAKTTGSGQRLDSAGAFDTSSESLWGLPAIASSAITQGQALVGDFNTGVTCFVREAANIRLSDSDQDDFVNNRVTLLAEGRFGVAVWQPAAFCTVGLATGEN